MKYKDIEYKLCIECKHCDNMTCGRKEYVDLVDGKIYTTLCSTERSPGLDDAYSDCCGSNGKYWEAKDDTSII